MTDDKPTFYVMGSEVDLHGFTFGPAETNNGQQYIQMNPIVRFPQEHETTELEGMNRLRAEGGISTIYEYARENNMLPDWVIDNKIPPWEREDD